MRSARRAWTMVAALSAILAGGLTPAGAAPQAARDCALKMKVSNGESLGPVLKISVKNRGTADVSGAVVSVRANDESGAVLWSQTTDLPVHAGGKFEAHVFPPEDCLVLVATVTLAGGPDERPGDNSARAAVLVKPAAGHAFVGRALYQWNCASCHGVDATGGSGPSLVGAKSKTILLRAADGGDDDHFAPWMSRTDAADLARYLRAPGAVPEPPTPPPAPAGGWPGFEADVRPVFDDYCGACHFGRGYRGGVLLDNYRGASRSAARSIYAIKSGSMPQGGRRVKSEDLQTLQDWIAGGRRP